MITYSRLGHARRGRLGNQLFQIASTVGLARKYGHDYVFPEWGYAHHFERKLPVGYPNGRITINEKHFHHDDTPLTGQIDYDIDGWRQSERYWEDSVEEVRQVFGFQKDFEAAQRARFAHVFERPVIAISIRRGDFVRNPNYAQLPPSYYIGALLEHFPDFERYNILFFSDDIPYCKVHFECLPNAYFADGADIEQLCLMSMCNDFIVSNSTFSWWGAWLGEKRWSRVIRPAYLFDGKLLANNSDQDYWPKRWNVYDHKKNKIDLHDTTFTIPVYIDHPDRLHNLYLNVAMLLKDFNTNIIVGEQGGPVLKNFAQFCQYHHFKDMRNFHRTKMLNDMARMSSTPIVVNWDCDIFVPPMQIWLAAERLRNGGDMVYPYDGRFARVPRTWHPRLDKMLDVGIFGDTQFKGKHGKPLPTTSVGGAIMFNRESFFNGGAENEYMISFGPEDWERNFRFKALGYNVERIEGALYHLDHFIGPNSSTRNPFFAHNHLELDKVRAMDADQLSAYVVTWPWRQ